MRIVQVLPGSGDRFYCENCVRDNSTVRALLAAGQDVIPVPMYLPPIVDPVEAIARAPVFFGGINSWLQQKSAFFRKTPRWLDRLFDSKLFLRMAARSAGSVRASGLGDLTLSMLRGAEGNQAKELARLIRHLESMEKPDLVHLSSPLLLGVGVEIQRRLGVPLVCSMQDEDVWIDAMEEPHRSQCWEVMASAAREVDAFIAVSRWFGEVMRGRLKLDPSRLHVVPVGIDPGEPPSGAPVVPAIGFLARMSEGMGLRLLADAYLELKKGTPDLRLHLSGGSTSDDAPFLDGLHREFADRGVDRDVQVFEEFDPASRRRFLASLTVLSVPAPHGVAFGTYILEALAAGVPVVQPRVGSFPELVEATGGGVLYNPGELAAALGGLLPDGARRADLGRRGRESVVKSFSLEAMAKNMLEVYRKVVP